MRKILDYNFLKDLTWIKVRSHLFSFAIGAWNARCASGPVNRFWKCKIVPWPRFIRN